MALRLRLLAVPLTLLAFAPATAHAVPSKAAAVSVSDCDADAASATFESKIRAVRGATRLQVRFSLQSRGPSLPSWAPIKVPGFDTWLSSRTGKRTFVYDKTLEALAPGDYRVLVRFRWRDASGETLATATRRSKACEQPDPRPDLVPRAVSARGGRYTLEIANVGGQRAAASTATLRIGGVALTPVAVGSLDAGDDTDVVFEGPACRPGDTLVATADAANAVDEGDEAGNVLTVPCPS